MKLLYNPFAFVMLMKILRERKAFMDFLKLKLISDEYIWNTLLDFFEITEIVLKQCGVGLFENLT